MVVEDKEKTLKKVHEISNKMMSEISKELSLFNCEDDPAEYIYLACHVAANIAAKTSMALGGYAQIYGIEKMYTKTVHDWIKLISEEILAENKDFLDKKIEILSERK